MDSADETPILQYRRDSWSIVGELGTSALVNVLIVYIAANLFAQRDLAAAIVLLAIWPLALYWLRTILDALRFGHFILVYRDRVFARLGRRSVEAQFQEIKGFAIDDWGDGPGIIYLVLKDGQSIQAPPTDWIPTTMKRLSEATGLGPCALPQPVLRWRKTMQILWVGGMLLMLGYVAWDALIPHASEHPPGHQEQKPG